jgi:hypothetical protein
MNHESRSVLAFVHYRRLTMPSTTQPRANPTSTGETVAAAASGHTSQPPAVPAGHAIHTTIYCTDDLSVFRLDPANRPVLRSALERLQRHISRHNLLADNPILVTPDLLVLDGQKRLLAAGVGVSGRRRVVGRPLRCRGGRSGGCPARRQAR